MSAPSDRISPAPIIQMASGYWASCVLLTANRLGLFTVVGDGELATEALARKLGLAVYPLDNFLDALVSLGYLEKRGTAYANSALSRTFLVEGAAAYLGNAIKYSDDLYPVWGKLEETLRSGKPALPPQTILGDDVDKTRHFVLGMHNRALGIGQSLASAIDLAGKKRLLDVGGGPGTYSCLLAKRNPGLTSRSMDLPAVVAIARTIIAEMGMSDRVEAIVGDYNEPSYPDGNDAVLCSGMFHREPPESCRAILHKAFRALDPGGIVVVHDVLCSDDKSGPPFAMLFGINMALTSAFGTVYSGREVATWMGDAGFVNTSGKNLPPPWPEAIVVGYKP